VLRADKSGIGLSGALALVAVTTGAWAAGVAVDTGPIATHVGRGCGTRDASRLQNLTYPSLSKLGHSVSVTGGTHIADDFTLSSETLVKSITFYVINYTGITTCAFDVARVQIWDGPPNAGGSIVFGDLVSNRLASCAFSNIYRDAEVFPGACDFPVMAVTATVNTTLPAGTYWADFQVGVNAIPETYVVPVTRLGQEGGCGTGCNALRYNGSSWGGLNDNSTQQDVKLVVNYDQQRTIQDGNAAYTWGPDPFDDTPGRRFVGLTTTPTQNQLNEAGWAYRWDEDPREYFLGAPDIESYGGSSATLTWNDVDSRGLFKAVENSQIVDTGLGGYVYHQMQITNLSMAQTLHLELFHYADIDAAGSLNDSADLTAWTPGRLLHVEDSGGTFLDYWADASATAFQAGTWNTAGDIGTLLADTNIDDFDGSGVPFGPADFTGGYQFELAVPPSTSKSVIVVLGANFSLQCDGHLGSLFCDGFEHLETALWSSTTP